MKKFLVIVAMGISAFAADYTTLSITDLQALRGAVPVADQAAFRSALQTQVQALSTTDRQALQAANQANSATLRATNQALKGTQGRMGR